MTDGSSAVLEQELEAFERLAADISTRFTYLPVDELPREIEATLRHVVEGLEVDRTTVFELAEGGGAIEAVHFWGRPGVPPMRRPDVDTMQWYLGRLRRGDIVRFEDIEDELPAEATVERAYARQTGMKSNLSIPVSIGGRLVCALAIGTFTRRRAWPEPLVERVRLIAQIIAGALQRRRHELALRESLAEIKRLNRRLQAENAYLQEEIKSSHDFDDIVGDSEPLRLALTRVQQVAPTGSTVLLLGESGTGKELFARAIHARSPRRQRTLVRVNCAALPGSLIESELFGHEKGAFTGAIATRPGRFELADGATIFLDEIGDLPIELQGRLLRVLQEGEFERVGSSRTRRVDVRVIAATNHDLEAAVKDGRFRADLYYRLSVFPIVLPPLRDRPEDIPQLVWHFISAKQNQLGRHIAKVPAAVMDALQRHPWPGNIRELHNVVEQAMIRSVGDVLLLDEGFGGRRREPRELQSSPLLADVERLHIEAVLAECGWRINGPGNAAERLGLHPNTLRFRMKKLGIVRPRATAASEPARRSGVRAADAGASRRRV